MSDIQTQKSETSVPQIVKPDGTPASEKRSATSAPTWRKPLIIGILVIAIIGGGILGQRAWSFGRSHVSTDDAYVTGTIVAISPKVSGNVLRVLVKENQEVKVGDLLAELDPSTFQADVQQAEANVAVAKANESGATSTVSMTSAMSDAQIEMANGGVSQMSSMISGAEADERRSKAAVLGAEAAFRSSKANVQSAKAAIETALSQQRKASIGVQSSKAQIENSQAAVRVAKANLATAQANLIAMQANSLKAEKDEARFVALFKQDAISAQQLDGAKAVFATAQAQTEAAREQASAAGEQVSQALQIVAQREADLKSSQEQIKTAAAGAAQAKALFQSAKESSLMSSSSISQAQAQLASAQEGVSQARAKRAMAVGQLHVANTMPEQTQVSKAGEKTASAKVLQAIAALENAKIALQRTKLYAPVSGVVSKKTLEIGQQLTVGQTVMAILPKKVWVIANFKETQTTEVHEGQEAEIEVDSLPGRKFAGRVQSLAEGTGATFALLPPDNATGNFTKVVQRVSVKVVFDDKQEASELLRSGLSAVVSITTKSGAKQQ